LGDPRHRVGRKKGPIWHYLLIGRRRGRKREKEREERRFWKGVRYGTAEAADLF